ncbi:BRCA1 BRCA2-containing complex, subunit 3 [Chytridiales sp. JEL 0842]|nr:BRCA1 BRCA2-containing complex, subunit 3 [Chytridiales sp. JEL 0842]
MVVQQQLDSVLVATGRNARDALRPLLNRARWDSNGEGGKVFVLSEKGQEERSGSHSHPHITVFPSAVDLRCQSDQQMLDARFIGLILSCFNERDLTQRLQLTCFQSRMNDSGTLEQVKIPVYIEPVPHGLDAPGLGQLQRIPRIFFEEGTDHFNSLTGNDGSMSVGSKKMLMSYYSGNYIQTLTSLADKLCAPMIQVCEERHARNLKEIERLKAILND